MKRVRQGFLVLVAAIPVLSFHLLAQEPPATQEPTAAAPAAGAAGQRGAGARNPRPYDQVITREAKTDKGVFFRVDLPNGDTRHRIVVSDEFLSDTDEASIVRLFKQWDVPGTLQVAGSRKATITTKGITYVDQPGV